MYVCIPLGITVTYESYCGQLWMFYDFASWPESDQRWHLCLYFWYSCMYTSMHVCMHVQYIYKSVYVCVYVFIYIIYRICFWWIVLRPYLEASHPATSTWREQKPDILWYAESNLSEVEIHREDTGMLFSTCITLSTFAMMLVCNKAKTAAGWSRAGPFGALGSYSAILWATIKYTVYCVQLL